MFVTVAYHCWLSFFGIIDLLKPDTTVIFSNVKIDMFKGTMRLAVVQSSHKPGKQVCSVQNLAHTVMPRSLDLALLSCHGGLLPFSLEKIIERIRLDTLRFLPLSLKKIIERIHLEYT
jgi:hypothetical protein